jgi:hypothetical protein
LSRLLSSTCRSSLLVWCQQFRHCLPILLVEWLVWMRRLWLKVRVVCVMLGDDVPL